MELIIAFAIILSCYSVFAFIVAYKVLRTERLGYEDIWEFDKALNNLPDEIRDIPYESHYLVNEGGLKLHARLFYADIKTDKFVFLNHGNTCVYTGMLKYVDMLKGFGLNVFAPDHRGRGESDGKYNSFGYYEYKDCLLWLEYLRKIRPDAQIAVMGESMGGAVSLLMAQNRDDIELVISDCAFHNAYCSVRDVLVSKLGKAGVIFMPMVNLLMKLVNKVNLIDVDAAAAIKNIGVPVLLIHGEKDTKVKVESAYLLHEKNPDNEIEIFEDAEHANCIGSDPGKYYNLIKSFLIHKGFIEDETD
ncbi:MAG: alpha/beta hydrolase [Christensenellales bacterium]|jgi:alpha-beta hydrolase superfamily lysophospholipase